MQCHKLILSVAAFWGFFLLSNTVDAKSFGQEHFSDVKESEIYRGDFKCPFWFGTYGDPTDCAYFYICMGGKARRQKCPRFTNFCTLRRRCVASFVAVCAKDDGNNNKEETTENPTTISRKEDYVFSCPSMFGSFPDPHDCSKYYKCTIFQSSHKTCPEKQLFDAVKKECRDEQDVHCGDRERPGGHTTAAISTETVTENPTETITEKPTETVTDAITDETEKETPIETTLKDGITPQNRPTGPPPNDCEADDVDCIIDETGDAGDWFVCPEAVGSYPHPSSDKLFVFCKNWIPSAKKCGSNLVFSKELSTCVEIAPEESEDDLNE